MYCGLVASEAETSRSFCRSSMWEVVVRRGPALSHVVARRWALAASITATGRRIPCGRVCIPFQERGRRSRWVFSYQVTPAPVARVGLYGDQPFIDCVQQT